MCVPLAAGYFVMSWTSLCTVLLMYHDRDAAGNGEVVGWLLLQADRGYYPHHTPPHAIRLIITPHKFGC